MADSLKPAREALSPVWQLCCPHLKLSFGLPRASTSRRRRCETFTESIGAAFYDAVLIVW